jgi:hypothetical protein
MIVLCAFRSSIDVPVVGMKHTQEIVWQVGIIGNLFPGAVILYI